MRDDALPILVDMSRELITAGSLDEGLRTVTETALQLVNADHASVRLCDNQSRLRVGARAGVGLDRTPPVFTRGQGVMGWVAETGQIARIADSASDPRFEDRAERGFPVRSVMSVPLSSDGKVMGVLSMSAARQDAFTEDDEKVSVLLANCAAQMVRMAELEQLAITDPQTQAFNRRYLTPRLTEEMRRAQRSSTPLSLVLMDLDQFKRVNDEHGHAVGDAVLKAFTDIVRECVRSVDILVRRGGEEFVLIMPSTNTEHATEVAERIRHRLRRQPLRVHRRTLLVQTVSIGVATWDEVESPEDFEERADLAMYDAKRQGRNRVVLSTPRTEAQIATEQHITEPSRRSY